MNIKYKTIRRVRITAPMSEREKVFDWCYKNGYRTIRTGPRVIRGKYMVDFTNLLVVAEKEIN